MSIREAAVMGSFYPANPQDLEKMFDYYNDIIDKHLENKKILDCLPEAVIVPHAGYVYSAFTANMAYRVLKNKNPKKVVIIGPSHRVYLDGASVAMYEKYQTPFGYLEVDQELSKNLKEKFGLVFEPNAHKEHSTEVQMPFLKYYIHSCKVVEIVYGRISPQQLEGIIEYILKDEESVVVISSDLSHYYDIQKANRLDSICMEAVDSLDTNLLHSGCEACGILGIEGIMLYAKKVGLKPVILDYRTSADASGDKEQVVGYMSAAFC